MEAVNTKYCNTVFRGNSKDVYDLNVEVYTNESGQTLLSSFWKPTPEEIQAIVDGKLIMLSILGTKHPPVRVHVLNDASPS